MSDKYSKSAARLVRTCNRPTDKESGAEKALSVLSCLLKLAEPEYVNDIDEPRKLDLNETTIRLICDEITDLFIDVGE